MSPAPRQMKTLEEFLDRLRWKDLSLKSFQAVLVVTFLTLLTGCDYASDFWNRYWQNDLTGWEWLLLIVLIILLFVIIIIIILLVGGEVTIGGIIAGIIALLELLWTVIIWPFIVWLFRDVIWWLIRHLAVNVVWRLLLRPLWRWVLAPVWNWFRATRVGAWLVDRVTDNAVWDGIKAAAVGVGAFLAWLFTDEEDEETEPIEVACGTRINIGPFERVRTTTHRDYPGGKGESEIIQDAIDAAETDARGAAEASLRRMIDRIHCIGDCEKVIVNQSVTLKQPTPVDPDRGYVWSSFEAKATATSRATVHCRGEETGD